MPTTVFPITNPAVVLGGQLFPGWANSASGRASINPWGNYSGFDVVATGTDLTMKASVSNLAATGTVSIDGAAATTITQPGTINTWSDVTLFSGLSDAAHTVSYRSGTIPSFTAIDLVNSLSLTGSAPAISLPSWGGPVQVLGAARVGGSICFEGCWVLGAGSNYGYPPPFSNTFSHSLYRFRGTGTQIRVWTFNAGQKYRVTQDGVLIGSLVTAPNTSTFEWVTLATGLDAGTEHEYAVVCNSGSPQDYAICLAGGPGVNPTPAGLYPDRDVLACFGDSITDCTILTDRTAGWPFLLAQNKGYHLVNLGISGTTAAAVTYNANPPGSVDRVRGYWQYSRRQPSVVIYNYGHNDLGGTYGTTAYQSAVSLALAAIVAEFPAAKVLAMGILPTSSVTTTVLGNFNTAMAAAVTALGNANVSFIDTTGWIVPGTDTSDGIHPSVTGNQQVYNRLGPFVPVAGHGGSLGVARGRNFGGI